MSDREHLVGLVGLGQMGGAICRTLLGCGWGVLAWDVDQAKLASAVDSGARATGSPADLVGSVQCVLTSVPGIEAIREIAFGESGLTRGECGGRILVDTSTIPPWDARELAPELASRGMGFIDAPVSGGVRGAQTGQLAVMVGGELEHVELARPILSCIGSVVAHCGAVGAGQIAKACNQLIVMMTHEAIAEALVLAQKSGLDPWRLREALLAGYASSPILEIQGPKMIDRDFTPGGKAVYHLKDIATITQLSEEVDLALPGFLAVASQIELLVDGGGGDLDNSALVTVVDGTDQGPALEEVTDDRS